VPFGIFGTVWARLKLREQGERHATTNDWWGNATFAIGLVAVLVAITYGIEPYGGHTMGWTSPKVLTGLIGGVILLAAFVVIELHVQRPMFNLALFRIRAFSAARVVRPWRPDVHPHHLAAGDLAAPARLQLCGDPAVGRHLHDPDDRRVLDRRAALGDPL
jgi:hypothetical protein